MSTPHKKLLPLDLHLHSVFSNDGEFSVEQLCKQALEINIQTIAIADHNNVDAINFFLSTRFSQEINIIPAVELDCILGDIHLHLLGYGIDPHNYDLIQFCEKEKEIEKDHFERQMELIHKKGLFCHFVDVMNQLTPGQSPCFEHIAHALLKDPRNASSNLLMPYRLGGPRSHMPEFNFYLDYGRKDQEYSVERHFQKAQIAIDTIKSSGGIPVLAHPQSYSKFSIDLLKRLQMMGLLGIELFSSYHDFEFMKELSIEAERLHLQITAGSDFHGKFKPQVNMGVEQCIFLQHQQEKIIKFIEQF